MTLATMTSLTFEQPFPCTRCGACCRSVSLTSQTAWLDRGDGSCKYLDEKTTLCKIYEARPKICRIDFQFQTNYQQKFSWQEFCEENQKACADLKKLHS